MSSMKLWHDKCIHKKKIHCILYFTFLFLDLFLFRYFKSAIHDLYLQCNEVAYLTPLLFIHMLITFTLRRLAENNSVFSTQKLYLLYDGQWSQFVLPYLVQNYKYLLPLIVCLSSASEPDGERSSGQKSRRSPLQALYDGDQVSPL